MFTSSVIWVLKLCQLADNVVRPCLSYGSGKASQSFTGMEIGECKAAEEKMPHPVESSVVCDAKLAGIDKIWSPAWQQTGNNGGTCSHYW